MSNGSGLTCNRLKRRVSRYGMGGRCCLAVVLLISFSVAGMRGSPARATTPQQVDQAIAKAKAFLYSKQKNGNWEGSKDRDPKKAPFSEFGGQWGGRTALVTYALLASGEDPRDPAKVGAAVEFLKHAKMVGVYALGCRCQVWLLLPRTTEIKRLARADADTLDSGFLYNGAAKNLYGYVTDKKDMNNIDHSVSQFGVLGMWACEQLGVPVPSSYWVNVEKRWVGDQAQNGGWYYKNGPGGDFHGDTQGSMTAAGVATLFITQDYVHADSGARCTGNITNKNIDLGLKYMADHKEQWTPDVVFGEPAGWYSGYSLYGVERIGVASGLKYFGDIDWYQYGADWCIEHQDASGAWRGDADIDNTAFCLLFLSRGRAPVLVNKVMYENATGANKGKQGHWNERPREVANFVRWMGRQTERELSWQTTNLNVPVDELHDAPFLYFAGNEALSLTPEQAEKLKQFSLQGGMILFNADCGAGTGTNQSPFVGSVVKLAHDLFPNYDFRDLPADSRIFNEQYSSKRWKQPVQMKALSNGIRELMVLLPQDPGRTWQLQNVNGSGNEEAYQSMADLILYGTDGTPLRVKGTPYLVKNDAKVTATKTVRVARLKYAGNWDPEPAGWTRLAAILHNKKQVDLDVQTVELGTGDLSGFAIAHLTGTSRFKATPAQVQALAKFAEGGGTIVIDVGGGSAEFAQSAEPLIEQLFPKALGDPLPPKDAIYSAFDPELEVRYRNFARSNFLGSTRSPQLRAVRVNKRNVLYYSREDLSGGLVGESVDGIIGYDPESATAIMAGIMLGSAK